MQSSAAQFVSDVGKLAPGVIALLLPCDAPRSMGASRLPSDMAELLIDTRMLKSDIAKKPTDIQHSSNDMASHPSATVSADSDIGR